MQISISTQAAGLRARHLVSCVRVFVCGGVCMCVRFVTRPLIFIARRYEPPSGGGGGSASSGGGGGGGNVSASTL